MSKPVRGPDGQVYNLPDDATDADLVQFFTDLEQASAQPPARGGIAGYNVVGDLLTGAVKGAGSTVKSLADMGRRYIPGFAALDKAGSVQIGDTLEPTNTAQGIGKEVEQVGEYLLPGGAASRGALRLAPKLAPMLGRAAPMAARAVTGAAAAAPIAAVQGDDPVAAGTTGGLAEAVLPPAGDAVVRLGRRVGGSLVRKGADFSEGKLKRLAGHDKDAKIQRVTDTILDKFVTGAPAARRQIDAIEAGPIADVIHGPEGQLLAPVSRVIPKRLGNLERKYKGAVGHGDELAAVRGFGEEILGETEPLAHSVVVGQQQVPTGVLGPTGQPLTRTEDVMGRALRDNVTVQDAILGARRTANLAGDTPIMNRVVGREAARGAVTRGMRDAAKYAAPSLRAPMRQQSRLIEARNVLDRSASPDAISTGQQVGTALGGNRLGAVLNLLKQGGVVSGIGAASAGRIGGRVLDDRTLQALLTAYMAHPDDKALEAEVLRALTQAQGGGQ